MATCMPNCKQSHTHTHLTALCPGLPRWAGTRQVKPIWILLEQETVSGSGISWAICKSAPRCRQITMPALHYSSFFYRPDALPAAQPTVSKHWRQRWTWNCKVTTMNICHGNRICSLQEHPQSVEDMCCATCVHYSGSFLSYCSELDAQERNEKYCNLYFRLLT